MGAIGPRPSRTKELFTKERFSLYHWRARASLPGVGPRRLGCREGHQGPIVGALEDEPRQPISGRPITMAEQGTELREYLSILWARKWWALAVLGLVVASAIFYTVQQTPTYEASAQVLDQPVSFFAGAPPSSNEFVDMYTEQQIASSQTVARRAVRNVREQGLTPGTVSVSVPSSTSTILFTSTS